jgi:hypothetical protein
MIEYGIAFRGAGILVLMLVAGLLARRPARIPVVVRIR